MYEWTASERIHRPQYPTLQFFDLQFHCYTLERSTDATAKHVLESNNNFQHSNLNPAFFHGI